MVRKSCVCYVSQTKSAVSAFLTDTAEVFNMNNMNKQDGNKDKEKAKAIYKIIHDVAYLASGLFIFWIFFHDNPELITKAVAFWSKLFH